MANVYQNPFRRRTRLADQYKAIELEVIPSLFPQYNNVLRWRKSDVLYRLRLDYHSLGDQLRTTAATRLTEAAALRRQAMPLWPAGTEAADRHWEWIDILDTMSTLLRITNEPPDLDKLDINEPAPPVDDDEELWAVMDFDLYLEQMTHWRETLAQIWKMAKEDPKQMSVADIMTGCAVRYFRSEMAAMVTRFPGWYEANGAFRPDILEYMAKKGQNGIGAELTNIIQNVKEKKVKEMQENPLIDWMIDVVKANKEHIAHLEFTLAWLFVSDSMKLTEDEKQTLQKSTTDRLTEVLNVNQELYHILVPSDTAGLVLSDLATRVAFMFRYVMKQTSIASFAVVHTWADYTNVMMNSMMFQLGAVMKMAYIFDANMILNRGPRINALARVEQFCSRYSRTLYLGGRPTDEATWKETSRLWVKVYDFEFQRIIDKIKEVETTQVWVRVALDNNYITPPQFGFNMAAGTESWWQAIKEKATETLQAPPVIGCYRKVHEAFTLEHITRIIQRLRYMNWTKQRAAIDRLLEGFKFDENWFDGVVLRSSDSRHNSLEESARKASTK
ncbi:hypothetical protein CHU98_g1093 [Xylaria longipes]|nr:hypothetical protein CHU98_g1093 [Xylaria longipes]